MQELQETQVRSLSWEDPLRRAWRSTPVFLSGESHGQRSLVGHSPQGRRVRHDWGDLARITPDSIINCFVCHSQSLSGRAVADWTALRLGRVDHSEVMGPIVRFPAKCSSWFQSSPWSLKCKSIAFSYSVTQIFEICHQIAQITFIQIAEYTTTGLCLIWDMRTRDGLYSDSKWNIPTIEQAYSPVILNTVLLSSTDKFTWVSLTSNHYL